MQLTQKRLEERLAQLRQEHLLALCEASTILGRIQEVETQLEVLKAPEPEETKAPVDMRVVESKEQGNAPV